MTEQKGVRITSEFSGEQCFVPCDPGKTSDGYHTFDELYEHRCLLFAALMKSQPAKSWRAIAHHDGSIWDGWFIGGMQLPISATEVKQITYHLPDRLWDLLEGVFTLDRAPEWDGHTSADVLARLTAWIAGVQINFVFPDWEDDR